MEGAAKKTQNAKFYRLAFSRRSLRSLLENAVQKQYVPRHHQRYHRRRRNPADRPAKEGFGWGACEDVFKEAVQEAVNSAIKAKAADPIAHVASILERKGHEMEAKFAEQPSTTATAPPTG